MKTIQLNEGELAHLIGYSAKIGKALTGTIPSGNLHDSEDNKPFIEELNRLRTANETGE
ncbi:MAG: hypothetical protein GY941_28610 [Planctomycetes bacterium]|nr:hypothetical protein [Planctomycetota bacterium]